MNLVSLEEGRLDDVKYETLNKIGKVVSKPRNSIVPGPSIAGTNFLSTLCPPSINRFSKRTNTSLSVGQMCAQCTGRCEIQSEGGYRTRTILCGSPVFTASHFPVGPRPMARPPLV
jgi:hypothetical protein